MIIPYATDKTDNFIGYGAVGIIATCLLAFFVSWPVHSRLEKRIGSDSLMVWIEQRNAAEDSAEVSWGEEEESPERSGRGVRDVELPRGIKHVPGSETVEELEAELERDRRESEMAADSLMARARGAIARESPLYTFGFYPAGGHWLPGLITHQFLHGGWMHLLGNLIFFFAFGVAIERRFGLKTFLALYLVGGAFAALCQTGASAGLHGRLPEVTMIGASGSIAAIMGAFLRSYPRSRVKVFVWLFRPMIGQIPAWVFLGMWVVMEFLRSHFLMPHQAGGGTAYMAHVSGFFFGFVVVPFLSVTDEAREMDEQEKRLMATGPLTTWEQAVAAPRSPFSLPGEPPAAPLARSPFSIPSRPVGPPVFERPSTALADQAWDALERGEEEDGAALLQRQFQSWLRGGNDELVLLDEQVKRMRKKRPHLAIAPLVLYECGTRLAASDGCSDSARFCLEKVEESLADLPASLLSRCRTLLESLPPPVVEPSAAQTPAPSASIPPIQPRGVYQPPPRPPPQQPTAPGAAAGERPSWLVD
jgi:membrane associated rhomboid family serine protease